MTNNLSVSSSKTHFPILDGLRGVAAIVVVWFHIFEAFATSHLDQRINHGYLAVDFFYLLSGFVIAYAYQDRLDSMRAVEFLKRRLIRLHPMVIMGAIIGGILFYFQVCTVWDVSKVTLPALLLATLLNAFLIPALPGREVRGLGEMYPLNGPSWSLFFEYLANILYVFFIRKFSTPALVVLTSLAGIGLATFAIAGPLGDLCAGYSLTGTEFTAGILRVMFSFSAGMLMYRLFQPIQIKGTLWICSFVLIMLLAMPRIGSSDDLWLNGIYDSLCCIVAFPILVYLGASEKAVSPFINKICKFLGDLSYPLYMVHYPFIYLYYGWVKNNNLTFEQSLPGAIALFIGSIVLALVCLKLYDIPLRRLLSKRFLKSSNW